MAKAVPKTVTFTVVVPIDVTVPDRDHNEAEYGYNLRQDALAKAEGVTAAVAGKGTPWISGHNGMSHGGVPTESQLLVFNGHHGNTYFVCRTKEEQTAAFRWMLENLTEFDQWDEPGEPDELSSILKEPLLSEIAKLPETDALRKEQMEAEKNQKASVRYRREEREMWDLREKAKTGDDLALRQLFTRHFHGHSEGEWYLEPLIDPLTERAVEKKKKA